MRIRIARQRLITITMATAALLCAGAVQAATLTTGATVKVSDNHSVFDVSVFPGKAGYDTGTQSGAFGDGTVVDYRFFNNSGTTFNGTGYANGGAGVVSTATATHSSGTNGGALHWADVWTTNDPGSQAANFTTATIARSQGVTGTIDISGLDEGSLYFIYGSYHNPNTVALTMTGSGQTPVTESHTIDPPNTSNMAWVTDFGFEDAAAYDTITYTYTNTDTDASRARFMGVVVDDAPPAPPPPPPGVILGTGTGALRHDGVTYFDMTDPENDGAADANVNYNALFTSTDEPGFGGGEYSFNVFDNIVGGSNAKWCCNDPGGDGHQLTAQFGEPIQLTSFTITSSNDSPGRDPSIWEIQGSNDGTNFTTIYSHDDADYSGPLWTARDQVILFEAGTDYTLPASYEYIRYDVADSVSGGHALNELEYFDASKTTMDPPPPPPTQLLHHWTLDGMPGGLALDDVGTNDGTIVGDEIFLVPGKIGQAFDFGGTDDYVDFGGDVADMENPGKFSVAMWFLRQTDLDNATNHGVDNVLMAQSSNSDNDNFEVGTDGDQVELYVDTGGGSADATVRATIPGGIANNAWHHIVVTYDQNSANELKLYFNGDFIQQWDQFGGVLDGAGGTDGSPLTLAIARSIGEQWGDFDGYIDDVRIYDAALTGDEVAALFAPAVIPEPMTMLAVGLSIAGLGGYVRRRRS